MICLVFAAMACCHALAAPLVLKDDYRSPRNKERRLRKATTLIVLHTTEAPAKSSLNLLSELFAGASVVCSTMRVVDFRTSRSLLRGER